MRYSFDTSNDGKADGQAKHPLKRANSPIADRAREQQNRGQIPAREMLGVHDSTLPQRTKGSHVRRSTLFRPLKFVSYDRRSLALPALLLAGSLTSMAGGALAPVLPNMVQELGLNPALAPNLVSFHCLTIALFSPLLGLLADRVGRLRVLVGSLIFYALVGISGVWLVSLEQLLLLRALIGVASGGIAAAALGLLTSLYEGEARTKALGYATSTLTITGIIYPLLGGLVGQLRWQYAFGLYLLGLPLAGLALWSLSAALPPKQANKTKATSEMTLSQVFRQSAVIQLLLLLAIASCVMYSVVVYAPLHLKVTQGTGPVLNGLLLAVRAIGAALVSAFGTRWLMGRLGKSRTMMVGFGLMAGSVASIPLVTALPTILMMAVLFGVGFGIVLPSLYGQLADYAPPSMRSSVLAAGTGAGFLGQFLAPVVLAALVVPGDYSRVFYAAGGIGLLAASWRLRN